MVQVFAAQRIVRARLSDTGESATFVLADETGREVTVSLPAAQVDSLAAAAQALAGRLAEAGSSSAGPSSAGPSSAEPPAAPAPRPPEPVERWWVRPEADDEHVVLGFKLVKGSQVDLLLSRSATQAFTRALSSLLGRLSPAAPSKSRH